MLNSETRNGIEILSFENVSKLNILVAQSLKEEIAQYLNKPGKKIILNLEGIEYIDKRLEEINKQQKNN